MDSYQQFIHKSRYARYLPNENRREHWEETVGRYVDYMLKQAAIVDPNLRDELFDAIYHMHVMPSMRALMTAGKALDRDHTAGYNCSYLPVDDVKAFDEAMHILMCGT